MKVIFAQGNPGPEYAHTRHNVGFLAIDEIARHLDAPFTQKPKFHAEIAETSQEGEKLLLVKPTTFYNETGQAARLLVDFYKLDPAKDFLVIHDDLALPFGTIRTREKGSDAGNNGVKSLNAHLGQHYARIRVGIYAPQRDQINDVNFVLGSFTVEEKKTLPVLFEQIEHFAHDFIAEGFSSTKVTIP